MGDIDVVIGDAEETWKRIKETAKALNNRRQLLIAERRPLCVGLYISRAWRRGRAPSATLC